jgi:uncharacterized lipoprotein NlpE involved in copper resistance
MRSNSLLNSFFKRKIMAKILVAFIISLVLFGCNNNSSSDVSTADTEPAQEASVDDTPADSEPAQEVPAETE